MMDVEIGPEIIIRTKHGEALTAHVRGNGQEGAIVRSPLGTDVPVVVRIHSSCLFSESLLAVDCDCAAQLDKALQEVLCRRGLLVYLYEEGRGAGLRRKTEAIALQQRENIDTAEAFSRLGLKSDPREHELASSILKTLVAGQPIVLLTNNPKKVEQLKLKGLNIQGSERLIETHTKAMGEYFNEKVNCLGHLSE